MTNDWMTELGVTPVGPPTARGWVHFRCPWCAHMGAGTHGGAQLGFHAATAAFNCWRCGRHPVRDTLARLAPGAGRGVVARVARELIAARRTGLIPADLRRPDAAPRLRSICRWPVGMLTALNCDVADGDPHPLPALHRRYLEGRGYDPDALRAAWGLRACGPYGPRKLRLIVPVVVEGRAVTYTARDVTGLSPRRYMACPPEDEAMPIKRLLYGGDAARGRRTVVVVEGPTSVWRLGPGAVATWGTRFTPEQVAALGAWERRVVLFDSDDAGRAAAERLAWSCTALGGETRVGELTAADFGPGDGKDPADLTEERAEALMRELMG